MKADYKNWMPKGMVASFIGGTAGALAIVPAVRIMMPEGPAKSVVTVVSAAAVCAFGGASVWSYLMYRAFDYNGTRQMSKQIIEGISEYVDLPEGGTCLDVGCGSGALAIAIAKRNPKAKVTGIDRWGKEYASFNKPLCENNALVEGVENVSFRQGDATYLDFQDETSKTPDRRRETDSRESLRSFTQHILQCLRIMDLNDRRIVGDNSVRLQFFQFPMQGRA